MEIKKIKVSENLYNGYYGEGSVFENSANIVMSKDVFNETIEKLTKDEILSAYFRRSFMDNNLNLVTIEIPLPIIDDIDGLIKVVEDIAIPKYLIIKDQNFNLDDYLEKYTVIVNDTDEYEIKKDSELGKQLTLLLKFNNLSSKTNREIIDSINI